MSNYLVYFLGATFFFVVVIGNYYMNKIKLILNQNGYKTNQYYGHANALIRFNRLTKTKKELSPTRKYLWIALLTLSLGFLIMIFIYFISA